MNHRNSFNYVSCTCRSVCRRLDVLRHRLAVSDGSPGGGTESARAGPDPPLVYYEAADRLPRAPQQTCRHMLLLLGGSYARGADQCVPDEYSDTRSCKRQHVKTYVLTWQKAVKWHSMTFTREKNVFSQYEQINPQHPIHQWECRSPRALGSTWGSCHVYSS